MSLRDRMKPKQGRAINVVGPHGIGCTCGEDSDAMFTIGFSTEGDRNYVAVFAGEPEDDDSPLFVVPVFGELSVTRKDHIANKVLDMMDACLDSKSIAVSKTSDLSSDVKKN